MVSYKYILSNTTEWKTLSLWTGEKLPKFRRSEEPPLGLPDTEDGDNKHSPN